MLEIGGGIGAEVQNDESDKIPLFLSDELSWFYSC